MHSRTNGMFGQVGTSPRQIREGRVGGNFFQPRTRGLPGQVFSIDFVVAMMVFVLCLVFVDSFWHSSSVSANQAVERNRLASSALVATDALLYSPGVPSDWEENVSEVRSLGLAKKGSPNEIDPAKLANFTSLPNDTVRSLLGIRAQYNLKVEGLEEAGSYSAGNESYGGERATGIVRYAVLDGKMMKVSFFVHE